MAFDGRPLLERQRIFSSRNVEEARAFLTSKEFRFELLDRFPDSFDARINGVYLPGMYLGYIQYGSPVATRATQARNDYWIQFPIRGHIEARIGRDQIDCDSSRAVVWSPTGENTIRSDTGCTRLNVSLTNSSLRGQLAALLDQSVDEQLEFKPSMNLAEGYGRSLARYVRLAVAEFEREDTLLWTPIAMTQVQQFIMTGLLLAHPHNYTEALRLRDKPLTPRDVKRAIEYMQENAQAAITLADIVGVSRVAGRTLLRHFRDYYGTSPMSYLRKVRFEKVQQALRRAGPEASIAQAAESWGFNHLGRFSVEYRKRFGESPSETARRGRTLA